VQDLLEIAGVADLIAVRTSSGDVELSKPDADIMHAALAQIGLDADEVVMIGDTPFDVASAGKLDIPTIALRCGGGHPDTDLIGAAAIYDDPADLLAHYDDSILARGVSKWEHGKAQHQQEKA
jgi:phosphoglycolate phosphatase-like HAD superfamily hydrolase